MVKKIASFDPTEAQRKWVDDECERTLETQVTVMRKLIQEKIDGDIYAPFKKARRSISEIL